MEDYKPNSNLSKKKQLADRPEKKIEKIITSDVKVRKKSGFQKFIGNFVREDAGTIVPSLFEDVIVPSFQKMLFEFINNGSEMMIYGPNARRDRKRTPGSRVSYRDYYDDRDRDRRDTYRDRDRASDLDNIILPTRDDAERVLTEMDNIIDRYDGIVTVSDLYDLVGVPSRHTDNKFGWTSLRNAYVERVRDGYTIRLPRPMAID